MAGIEVYLTPEAARALIKDLNATLKQSMTQTDEAIAIAKQRQAERDEWKGLAEHRAMIQTELMQMIARLTRERDEARDKLRQYDDGDLNPIQWGVAETLQRLKAERDEALKLAAIHERGREELASRLVEFEASRIAAQKERDEAREKLRQIESRPADAWDYDRINDQMRGR